MQDHAKQSQQSARRSRRGSLKRPPLEPLNTSVMMRNPVVQRLTEEEKKRSSGAPAAQEGSSQAEPISEINNWLFLGSLADALDSELLGRKRITCILNVAQECESTPELTAPHRDEYFLHLNFNDHCDEVIIFKDKQYDQFNEQFKQAMQFIKQVKERKENVLVHCQRGISRGATMVIAYLMVEEGFPLNDAFAQVQCRRPFINPNLGFVIQLEALQKKLYSEGKVPADTLIPPPPLPADSSLCSQLPQVRSPNGSHDEDNGKELLQGLV